MVGDEIHVAGARVLIFEIDSWRENLVTQCKRGDSGFQTPPRRCPVMDLVELTAIL